MSLRVTHRARRSRCITVNVTLLLLSACGRSDTARSVTVYVSTDRVFSEPVLQEYQRRSGVTVNAVYDTEETKSTGLANRLLAEQGRPQADVLVQRTCAHLGVEIPQSPRAVSLAEC